SGGDATLDSEADATLDSEGDATTQEAEVDGTPGSDGGPPDAEGDAAAEDAASDAPAVVDAADAGDTGDGNAPDGGCSPVGSYQCAADGHPRYCQADGTYGLEDCANVCTACGGLVGTGTACSNW